MSEMPKSRIHYATAVGFVVTVSLLALALQVGLTTAATGTSNARAAGTLQGKVRIEVKGRTFTISGAISDRGRYADSGGVVTVRRLVGAKGIIWIKIGWLDGTPVNCQCNWRVIKGTKAYAGLRGRGHEEGMYSGPYASTTRLTMSGTVWQ
jgi:hypothetical protein